MQQTDRNTTAKIITTAETEKVANKQVDGEKENDTDVQTDKLTGNEEDT